MIVDIPVPHGWQIRVLKVRVDCAPKIALCGLGATVLEQAVEFLYGTCSSCEPLAPMGQAHRGPVRLRPQSARQTGACGSKARVSCEPLAPMGQAHRGLICFAPSPLTLLEHKVYWLPTNSIHVVGTSRPDVVTRPPKAHHTEFPTRLIHITKRNRFR